MDFRGFVTPSQMNSTTVQCAFDYIQFSYALSLGYMVLFPYKKPYLIFPNLSELW